MIRLILSVIALQFAALPAMAACTGADLIAAMPADQRAALRQAANAQPFANGIHWRAEKGDSVIHLVGTLHTADARHAATLDRIKPLIARADTVFLELGEGDEKRMNDLMAREPGLAFIVEGPTLPELLNPQEWNALRTAMADRGVPSFMTAKMKPWMAMLTMGLSKCVFQQTIQGARGLDHMIMELAASVGNPAQALEPFDTAMQLFNGYTEEELLDFLRLTIAMETVTDPDSQHATMTEAYFREEIRLLWELAIQQTLANPQGYSEAEILTEFARLEEALLNQRNRAWMIRILPAAEAGEVFIAAGALHLPGDNGLLRLLELEGYQILPVPGG